MSLSNTHGWLVLSTGNKSETAVGYSTIYGDMVGGYALLIDVYKTDVFRLSRHLNERAGRELIPVSTIERPPTAELRADQRDDQSLPPYEVLDPILEAYVELDRSREELEAAFDAGDRRADTPARRSRRVQAPPGCTRRQAPPARLRSRLADADHQQVEGLKRRGVASPRPSLSRELGQRRHGPPVPHGDGRRQAPLRERLHELRPRLAIRDADVELASARGQLVGEVGDEVAETEGARLDRLAQERDDDLRRVVDRVGLASTTAASSLPARTTTGTSRPVASASACSSCAARSSGAAEAGVNTTFPLCR